ncbi:MAG TPA: hypothetical protein VFJ47_00485 [Terriglobales bacterium]|nr:hypothetical protein [Terriglobales bacterium]
MYRFVVTMCLIGFAVGQTSTPADPAAKSTSSSAASSSAPSSAQASDNTAAQTQNSGQQDENAKREREGNDSFLDLPALPKDSRVSLIGGKVISVDRIMDRMEIQPFGGKRTELAFDVRTQVYRDGVKIAPKDVHPGDRVYADTLLDKDRRVFAKSIRVVTKLRDTDRGHGQVVEYDAATGKLVMRDELLSRPLTLHLTRDTVFRKGQGQGSIADLKPGTLVAVSFVPGGEAQVQELSILAVPGSSFIFSGPVTHLDLSTHLLVIANRTDGKVYELDYDPGRLGSNKNLREGSDVTVNATVDGTRYVAQQLQLIPEGQSSSQSEQK